MNGARFVHDRLELAGWLVEIADAQKVKGLAPLACKTDRIDAWVLAELARRDLVPAIWLPDPRVRAERERARWRLHLVRHRSSLKQRVHAVLLTHGKPCPVSDLFGVRGRRLLARLGLPEPWQGTLEASLRLIDELEREITGCQRELRRLGANHQYVPLLLTVPGIGWVLAYTIAAEIGDINRFPARASSPATAVSAPASTSQASATCAARSATGPRYLRWALVEAATHATRTARAGTGSSRAGDWRRSSARTRPAARSGRARCRPPSPPATQRARVPEDTDWERIVALYDGLAQLMPSPVVELNRAVAVGMAFGPRAALEIVDALRDEPALDGYHLLPSVRGHLLDKLGCLEEARADFERAAQLTANSRQRPRCSSAQLPVPPINLTIPTDGSPAANANRLGGAFGRHGDECRAPLSAASRFVTTARIKPNHPDVACRPGLAAVRFNFGRAGGAHTDGVTFAVRAGRVSLVTPPGKTRVPMLSDRQLAACGCCALAVVSTLASSSASTARGTVRAARAAYTLDVARVESPRLGFVGLSGPFTSRADERPARLLVTTTFGDRFTDISPPAVRATRVDDVWFLDRANGWAVLWNLDTVRVTVYRTSDGGASSQPASAGGHSMHAGAVDTVQFLTRRLGWLVAQEPTGPGATLLRSGDGGASWRAVAVLPEVAPVKFESPREAWQSGGPFSRGLFHSTDGGRHWQPVRLPIRSRERTATVLYGSPAFFAREILAPVTFVRGRAVELAVYRSTDGGRRWARVSSLAPAGGEPGRCLPAPLSVSFASASEWWVGAYRAGRPVAYVTTDAGRHWQMSAIAASGAGAGCPLPQVQAVTARAAWVVVRRAHDSALYSTVDAGTHWRLLHPTPSR